MRVEATAQHGKMEISITNGGDPIPLEARERLFQPFYRASGSSTVGLGLGLFIAAEIATAHGGSLSMTSDETETRFAFTRAIEEVPKAACGGGHVRCDRICPKRMLEPAV